MTLLACFFQNFWNRQILVSIYGTCITFYMKNIYYKKQYKLYVCSLQGCAAMLFCRGFWDSCHCFICIRLHNKSYTKYLLWETTFTEFVFTKLLTIGNTVKLFFSNFWNTRRSTTNLCFEKWLVNTLRINTFICKKLATIVLNTNT